MIKLRLCEMSCFKTLGGIEEIAVRRVDIKDFCGIIYCDDKGSESVFRDAESIRFLKESENIVFADDRDLFSVIHNGVRAPLSALSRELKFALTVIRWSKAGEYVECRAAGEKIWKLLAEQPFDILIAICIEDLVSNGSYMNDGERYFEYSMDRSCHQRIDYPVAGVDYQIENYPYKDRYIRVTAKAGQVREDDFYTKVPGAEKGTPEDYLYRGKDGGYYVQGSSLEDAFRYHWEKDIGGLIDHIGSLENGRIRLEEVSWEYTIREMEERLNCRGEIRAKCKEDSDRIRIITHCLIVPERIKSRRLPVLMADRKEDGTYLFHDCQTGEHPDFREILGDVIAKSFFQSEKDISFRERFAIVVDRDEFISSVRDISAAVCGFRITENRVDIYDANDAIRLFGAVLKEACNSGG